jgi:hypothetical protein
MSNPNLQFFSLQELKKKVRLSQWFTPLNLNEEREKFLANPTYNPHFIYPKFDKKTLLPVKAELSSIAQAGHDDLEAWVFNQKIKELQLEIDVCLSRGASEISTATTKLYNCLFQEENLKKAKVDAASPLPFESKESKSPEEIVTGIKNYLAVYGVHDWQLELTTQSDFYFRVKASEKRLLISNNFNWDFTDFDNMLAHEIDGHVVRAINASKQTHPLLKKPLPFYIKTEEGLASFLGNYCSNTGEINRKHHALKYLAGHLALTSSFKEVFDFLCDHGFTPALAFQRTFRLKRGLENTSIPGCFAKEAMYYEGMLEVKNFLDNGGDIKKLYSGKVGLADIPYTQVPDDVIIPQRIKEYLTSHTQ